MVLALIIGFGSLTGWLIASRLNGYHAIAAMLALPFLTGLGAIALAHFASLFGCADCLDPIGIFIGTILFAVSAVVGLSIWVGVRTGHSL